MENIGLLADKLIN